MKRHSALLGLLLLAGVVAAQAAPARHVTLDHSSATLIDKPTALGLWQQHLTARVVKLYPVSKWGFVSQVEGGFDDNKVCVVTARAMMMPRSGKTLLFVPTKSATTFVSQPGATIEQCRSLAKTKLDEAIIAVRSSLLAD